MWRHYLVKCSRCFLAVLICSISTLTFAETEDMSRARERLYSQCDHALIQPYLSTKTFDSRKKAAYFSLVNEENYEKTKKAAGVEFADVFGANFSDFLERKKKYLSVNQFTFAESDARTELTTYLTDNQLVKWRECLEIISSATVFGVEISEANKSGAIVTLNWKPADGIGALRDITVYGGGAVHPAKSIKKGRSSFFVKRTTPEDAVTGIVNAQYGQAGSEVNVTSKIAIPAYLQPLSLQEVHKAGRSGGVTQVRDILRRGWFVNDFVDIDENTLLHLAVEQCNPNVVAFLLAHGATQTINKYGDSPLSIATVKCAADSKNLPKLTKLLKSS